VQGTKRCERKARSVRTSQTEARIMEASTNGKPTLLTKDQIFAVADASFEYVEVPEWGGTVRVKALTGAERDSYEESLLTGTGKQTKVSMANARAKLAARCIVDEQGNRVFNDKEAIRLGQKSAAALDRVYEVGTRLAKISKEDIEDEKGNSESDHSDDS
jgi:hypothetical protein